MALNSPVRMAVGGGRRAVCSPSSVCNTSVRVEDLLQIRAGLLDELLELGYLADLLEGHHFILLVTVDG